MRLFTLSLFLLLSFSSLLAQSFVYDIQLVDRKQQPVRDVKVWAIDSESGRTIEKRSDANGKLVFSFVPGTWSINLMYMPSYRTVKVRSGGKGSMSIIYDLSTLELKEQYSKGREGVVFKEIPATTTATRPSAGNTLLKIRVERKDYSPVANIPVALVDLDKKIKYTGTTNAKGEAPLMVPLAKEYAVDIADFENFAFTGDNSRPSSAVLAYMYQPTDVKQTLKGDTIIQHITDKTLPSTPAVLFKVTVKDDLGELESGESIYLNVIGESTVYEGKLDANGKITFLLPKTKKYMLHYRYMRDVDVISFYASNGIGSGSRVFKYQVNRQLKYPESFLPKPGEYFVPDYQEFLPQLEHVSEQPVNIIAKWETPMVGPQSREAILRLGITSTKRAPKDRKPINVVLVIDKSGSMDGNDRLKSVQLALKKYASRFNPSDNVSLITFNDGAFTELDLSPFNASTFQQLIYELIAGGGTSILKGLETAHEQIKAHPELGSPQVLLLTDGYGSAPPEEVTNRVREMNAEGIRVSAVGVGQGYNSALLKLITLDQGALFQHVGTSKYMMRAFEKPLNACITPIGTNAKIDITYPHEMTFKHLFGWKIDKHESRTVTYNIGDIFYDYNHQAIAEFTLPHPDNRIESMPVTITLTYTAENGKTVTIVEKAHLGWEPASGKMEELLTQQMKDTYLLALVNQQMKVFVDDLAAEKFDNARKHLDKLLDSITRLKTSQCSAEVYEQSVSVTNYSLALDNYLRQKGIGK